MDDQDKFRFCLLQVIFFINIHGNQNDITHFGYTCPNKANCNIFILTCSDYRKADSECDDGSFSQRNKAMPSLCASQNGNCSTLIPPIEASKSPKSNGVKQGGRRKAQNRSKAIASSSQNIDVTVSDDDSDVQNGSVGVDKTAKNNRRKRKEKEKVIDILIHF